MAVHTDLLKLAIAHPTKATVIAALVTCTILLFIVQEALKPVGKRSSKARLPPGPPGIFLFGSLLELKSARDDPHHRLVHTLIEF